MACTQNETNDEPLRGHRHHCSRVHILQGRAYTRWLCRPTDTSDSQLASITATQILNAKRPKQNSANKSRSSNRTILPQSIGNNVVASSNVLLLANINIKIKIKLAMICWTDQDI